MNIIEALNWRYAVRQFSNDRIDENRVQQLLNATRLSASSYGLQPYRLILVSDMAMREQLLPYAMGQDKVVHCSHLIVLAAQTDFNDQMINRYIHTVAETRQQPVNQLQGLSDHIKGVFNNMNTAQRKAWAHQQTYIALGTLLTTAAMMTIDSCPMTGFENDGFDQVLGLDKLGLESSSICALGVRHPEDSHAQLPKVRYPHSDMIIAM